MNNKVEKLICGVNKLCETVSVTLGPKGRNVVINQNGTPIITNDGVTIAKAFTCNDKIENLGCEIAKQASIQTNQSAGDGTTTALVLTKSLINNGLQILSEKVNPVAVKEGMHLACNKVCELIKKQSLKINNVKQLQQIANISCANSEISWLIASAFDAVGKDGVVCMEDSPYKESSFILKKGFRINFGLVSPYFLNNNDMCKFENCKVLVSATKLTSVSQLVNVLEECHNINTPLCIFAPSFSEEVIKTLIINNVNGYVKLALISASNCANDFECLVNDLCALTKATLVNIANISNISFNMLGDAENFEAQQDFSVFTNNKTSSDFSAYIIKLQNQLIECTDELQKVKLQKRISMLNGGIAVISVGAGTDIERIELKLRIEDAIESTRNAIIDGFVVGAGMALFKCKKKLKQYINSLKQSDLKIGAELVHNCLDKPLTQIAINCGINPDKLIAKLQKNLYQYPNYCFNAFNNKCVNNALSVGIIDAVKVPITALNNAVSVTATLLSTADVVCD